MMHNIAKRLIIVGIDGASYNLIKENAGRFKFLSSLLKSNNLKPLISTIPPSTVPAWMSIFTGVNPGKHGYFGFTEQHNYEYRLVRFEECAVPRVWNILSNHGLKSVVINVPIVYPVEPINGAMVAGMFSPSNKLDGKNIFPSHIIPLLRKSNYVIDIDVSELKSLSTEEVYDKLSSTIEARTETFKSLMDIFNAELGILVYTETDRVQHLYWYDKELVLRIYELVDKQISELLNHFDSPMIIVSDHGFRGVKRGVVGSLLLHELGYLKFRDDYYKLLLRAILRKLKGYKPTIEYEVVDWSKTLAYFRRDTWGFILNLAGRQPNGIVSRKESKSVLHRLISTLKSTDFFDHFYKSSELYQGSFTHGAPDMIVIPKQDIKLLSLNEVAEVIGAGKLIERVMTIKEIIKEGDTVIAFDREFGEHDLMGIVGVHGGYLWVEPTIYDVAPSILEFFRVKAPSYVDGRRAIEFDIGGEL